MISILLLYFLYNNKLLLTTLQSIMQYFYLLLLLPPEIVNIIYNINLKDKAVSSIIQFYRTRYQYNRYMKYLINNTMFKSVVSFDYIKTLQFALKNFYNLPKIYNNYFFKNLLTLLSYKLMSIHDTLLFDRQFIKNDDINIISLKSSLKTCINIWFKFCVKINCKISFYTINHISHKTINYRNYANKFKINSFYKMLYAPNILEYDGEFPIYKEEAYEYLIDKYYEIENHS